MTATKKRPRKPKLMPVPDEAQGAPPEATPPPPPSDGSFQVKDQRIMAKQAEKVRELQDRVILVEAAFDQSQEEVHDLRRQLDEANRRIEELTPEVEDSEDEDEEVGD